MSSAYEIFFNPDGTYKTSAQYLAETATCDADWGSATVSQRCVLPDGHAEQHQDRSGYIWGDGDHLPTGKVANGLFDMLTMAELHQRHNDLFAEHTRRYDRCAALHTLDPAYRTARAAMDETGETMHAIHAEITRREQELARNA